MFCLLDCFFFLFGAIDVYCHQTEKKAGTGPDQFFDSYVSLSDNFADRMCMTLISH